MFQNIVKFLGLFLVGALLINCPKKKEDDNTALLALLALSSGGASCEVTLLGTSIGSVPLTTAGNSTFTRVGTRIIGSNTVAVISARGVTTDKTITIEGSGSVPTIFKQSSCPLNTSQNTATLTTDYTLTTTSSTHRFAIRTAGDYLIFINTSSVPEELRAGVFSL